MKIIGFSFTKSDLRFCILEYYESLPLIEDKGKIVYPNNYNCPELMAWFETQLSLIIDKHHPDKISHKISLVLNTLDQIKFSCYPQAILNLVASKKNIPVSVFSSQAINATKFGQPKKTDVYKYIDTIIDPHPPYWDKATKDALLVAWFSILNT